MVGFAVELFGQGLPNLVVHFKLDLALPLKKV